MGDTLQLSCVEFFCPFDGLWHGGEESSGFCDKELDTDGIPEVRSCGGLEQVLYRVGQKSLPHLIRLRVLRINRLMEFSRQTTHAQLTEENQMWRDFRPTLYCSCTGWTKWHATYF